MSTIPPVVTFLVDALDVIADPARPISSIRFYGTKKSLAAYCTDGEMAVRIVVKVDASDIGQCEVTAQVAWERARWRRSLVGIVSALGIPAVQPPIVLTSITDGLARARLDDQFRELDHQCVTGLWGGRPMRKAFAVVEALGAAVAFHGNAAPTTQVLLSQRGLILDVAPRSLFADLDIVVMPRRES